MTHPARLTHKGGLLWIALVLTIFRLRLMSRVALARPPRSTPRRLPCGRQGCP